MANEKIRLGRTDLKVAGLGWGGIPIQRVGEEEAVSVVAAVVEMGVDLLDSARGYTSSEHRIGLALKRAKKPVVLSSKSPVKTAAIYNEVNESLRQLQVKKIDLYHLHNVSALEDYQKVMAPGGAYEGLLKAKRDGLIGHIGLTSHNLRVLEKVLEDGHFEVIMLCYSFLEPEAEEKVIPLARKRDVGVLAMKPFSGGVITEAGPALRYVLSTPDIVPIPGSETLDLARENWKVFVEKGALTPEDQEWIRSVRREFDRQFCRRCDYCQPCSQGIAIQNMINLKSLGKRFGSILEELAWVRQLIGKARTCTECGECLPRCPYRLPIPNLIKENLEWYDKTRS